MKKVFPGILMTISLFAQAVRADEGQDVRWHVTSRAQAPVVGQNPVRSFVATGTVRKVDRDNGIVTIFHQPVTALMWPSMTMPFAVGDKRLLERIKVGERMEFEFVRDGKNVVIIGIK